jgi:hypothetical protein
MMVVGESEIQDFDHNIEIGDEFDIFEELGNFNWGSQIVILYDPNKFKNCLLKENKTYFVGDSIFN